MPLTQLSYIPFILMQTLFLGTNFDALTLIKKDITQQASFLSSSTISRCEINPCQRRQACHSPYEILQFPFGTPLSEPLMKLKKLLEQNCTPEKVQYIFQLIEAGNLKDINWEDAMSTSIEEPPSDLGTSQALECRFPPCEAHPGCHAPDEVLQYPFGTPLPPDLIELKKLIEQNESEEKVKQLFGQLETRKLKNVNREIPMKGSIEFQPNDPVSVPQHTSMSNCNPPSCKGRPGCHLPDEVLKYPFGTTLPPDLVELKKLIEKNESEDKVNQFFGQLETRKLKNDNCEIPIKGSIDLLPNDPVSVPKLTLMSNCNPPSCKSGSGCHLPDEVLQYPFGTPLPPDLVELKKLIEQNESVEKVKHLFGQLQARNVKTCETLLKQPKNHRFLKSMKIPNRLPPNQELPADFLKNPPGTHFSPYLVELKKLLEQNNNPQKVQRIMNQIENANLKGSDGEGESPTNTSPDVCLTSNLIPKNSISVISSCHSPDEVLRCPPGYLSPPLQSLKYILEKYYNPCKVKRLFGQIETGDYRNLDWIGTLAGRPEYEYVAPQNNAPTTSHFCPRYTCGKRLGPTGCHLPHDVLQYPPGMELPEQLETVRKLLEHYNNPRVKHLFEPTECSGMQNFDCTGAAPTCCSPDEYSTSQSTPAMSNCTDPRCSARLRTLGCHTPDEVVQYPYGTSLPESISQLKTLIERKIQCNNLETLKTYTDFLLDNYPISESLTTISTCRIPPCPGRRSGCHLPDEVLQYPFGTPLPKNLEEFKKLLDHDIDPKKLQKIFEEIEAGNLENLDWECAMQILTELERDDFDNVDEPPSVPKTSVPKPSGRTCSIPPCDGRSYCHSPDNLLQYPFGTPLPKHLEELKKLLEDNCSPETVRHLFEQIEAGDLEDFKYVDCGESPKIPVVIAPDVCEPCECPPPVSPPPVRPPPAHPPPMRPPCVSVGTDYSPPSDIPPTCVPKKSPARPPPVRPPLVCPPPKRPPPVRPSPMRPPPVCPPPVRPTPVRPTPVHPPPVRLPCVSLGTDYSPPSDIPPTCASKKPAVQPGPSTVIVLPPEVYAPKPKDEDCAACHKPKYRNGIKMKCACSGKKKTVKINPPCPCELHKVPISKEEPGLKIDTRSIGDQCCICDEYSSKKKKSGQDVIFKLGQAAPSIIGVPGGPVSTSVQDGTGCIICPTGLPCSSEHTTCPKLTKTTIGPVPLGFFGQPDKKSEMGELEIIGPQGGYVIVGPGGIYTQAGIKEIRFSSGAGTDPQFNNVGAESTAKVKKNCLCFGKRKKKRKIVCQCPSESDQEPLLLYTYADYEEARKQSKIYKSNLTQTTSGFKFNKKKKPDTIPEAQYTMEDAIRDYAVLRPDFIRELVPPGVTRKGRKKDCACENDRGVGNYEILIPDGKGNFVLEKPEPEPPPVEEAPRPVLKFSIGGKGSGSKGLSGICCFEMYQDS